MTHGPAAASFFDTADRYASLFDGLARGYLFDPAFERIVAADVESGRHLNPDTGRAVADDGVLPSTRRAA